MCLLLHINFTTYVLYIHQTEDNQSSSMSRPPSMESKGHFGRNNIPFKGNRVPSIESTDSDMNSSLKPGLIPIRPGILPSKPGVTPGLGITPSRPQISKPGVTPGLGITPSRPQISKSGVTPGLGITPSQPQISKSGVTSGIAPSRPQIMKPGVTPTRPSITPLKPGEYFAFFIYPSNNPSIHPSIHLFIHPFINPSIHPSKHQSIYHSSIHSSIHVHNSSSCIICKELVVYLSHQ